MTGLRIVFMGTPEFACPTLRTLIERGENVVAVVTQPDRPKGRGQQTLPPPVKVVAQEHGIPVLQPVKVRLPESIEEIRALEPDLIVVIAFGQILPKALLDIPKHGCINVHASLLPRYRGAAPLNWCIINGETETGVTTMMMDVGLDTGDMLLKSATPIDPDEDTQSLHDRMSQLGAELLAQTLDRLVAGELTPEKQDDALTCYAPMMKKEDGLIDWTRSARDIKNQVRGMTPWPGAFSFLDDKLLKVYKVQTAAGTGTPGEVVAAGRDGIEVACGEGSLVIRELQLEGKKRMAAGDFLAGYKVPAGSLLGKKDSAVGA
ncbi:methionyl-tRNA formyltransferase [Geomonas sp. Red69]|uniref:Methionyl-tRNA formyltransferase n=1 Tax=Geomonas diazotrophica TaxID=2843197 RepID=A0ABX8JIG8_9BACT|nr:MULTISPECIES: methionyl-tRNA formyltransferase [Geomonas]MBU5635672.1 methionyl-tRNA formyltransferase [Geomonas diazotrophica]QWV98088.1 methionyl-tRNA formyltransferase [Geomonas nitrogeniifigens]QXE87220.1 methionyl-tRNA formyltransferase [Geomonas nitrogeniifigens]